MANEPEPTTQDDPEAMEPHIPRAWPFKRVFYGWAIVWAGFIASFGMVPMFGPVLGVFFEPIQAELGWSRAEMSLAFTIGSMTSSVFTMLFGRVIDRYGSRAIVVIAGVVIFFAMIGISFMYSIMRRCCQTLFCSSSSSVKLRIARLRRIGFLPAL